MCRLMTRNVFVLLMGEFQTCQCCLLSLNCIGLPEPPSLPKTGTFKTKWLTTCISQHRFTSDFCASCHVCQKSCFSQLSVTQLIYSVKISCWLGGFPSRVFFRFDLITEPNGKPKWPTTYTFHKIGSYFILCPVMMNPGIGFRVSWTHFVHLSSWSDEIWWVMPEIIVLQKKKQLPGSFF